MTCDQRQNSSTSTKEINFNNLYSNEGNLFLNFSSNSGVESDLFDYYISNLSKRRAFSDSSHNEYRSLIIPNCYNSPALFQSVIALAANDMVRTKPEQSTYYSSLTLRYKNEAINMLHNVLDTQPQFINSESSELLNEMVITILMLCSLEISDKGNKSWINHLKEGGMIFGSLTYSKILNSGMLLFAYRYFTLRYILLTTTLNDEELDRFISSCSWPLIEKFFDNDKVDYMLGCSPRLLSIIYNVTLLRHSRSKLSKYDFELKFCEVQERFANLNQDFNNADQSSDGLYLCSRAYYESTNIFMQSSLNTGDGDDQVYDSLRKVIQILLEFSSTSKNKALSLAPAWSLFIASTCAGSLMNDHVRISLLDIFENLEKFWPQASLYAIKAAVETIWKVNDLAFVEEMTRIDKPAKADWRDILSITGFKLALT